MLKRTINLDGSSVHNSYDLVWEEEKLEDSKTKSKTKTTFLSHVSSSAVIKLLSWSNQLNIKFQLIIKSKMLKKDFHAGGSDFRLYDGSNLKTYLLMRW